MKLSGAQQNAIWIGGSLLVGVLIVGAVLGRAQHYVKPPVPPVGLSSLEPRYGVPTPPGLPAPESFGVVLSPGEQGPPPDPPYYERKQILNVPGELPPMQKSSQPSPEELKVMDKTEVVIN